VVDGGPRSSDVAMALQLLEHMNLRPQDLGRGRRVGGRGRSGAVEGDVPLVTVVVRCSANGGRGAVDTAYSALSCVYRYAVDEGVIDGRQNVMSRVAKPKRSHSRRHGLDAALVGRIVEVASSTGNDPALDALLPRLHIETACRRGGAPALRVRDLDPDQCVILLREKGGASRWQPVSPALHDALDSAG
jgi:integrase